MREKKRDEENKALGQIKIAKNDPRTLADDAIPEARQTGKKEKKMKRKRDTDGEVDRDEKPKKSKQVHKVRSEGSEDRDESDIALEKKAKKLRTKSKSKGSKSIMEGTSAQDVLNDSVKKSRKPKKTKGEAKTKKDHAGPLPIQNQDSATPADDRISLEKAQDPVISGDAHEPPAQESDTSSKNQIKKARRTQAKMATMADQSAGLETSSATQALNTTEEYIPMDTDSMQIGDVEYAEVATTNGAITSSKKDKSKSSKGKKNNNVGADTEETIAGVDDSTMQKGRFIVFVGMLARAFHLYETNPPQGTSRFPLRRNSCKNISRA
jgi:hypothetical protein